MFHCDTDFNFDTFYDAERREWHGAPFREYYSPNASIGRILFESMRRQPRQICQISDTEQTVLSYGEALLHAIRVANYFRRQGLTQRDIVAVTGRNTTHLMTVAVACFFNGITLHAVNPNSDEKTKKLLFNITKPKMIFFDGQDYAKIQNASVDFETVLFTLTQHMSEVNSVLDLLQPTNDEHKFVPAELENGPEQTLAILCSSGTTGMPKAVTVSNNKRHMDYLNYLTVDDVLFVGSSLDWYTGLLNLVGSLAFGAKRIITERPFSSAYFLELIQKYKVTFVIVAPPSMAMLLADPALKPEQLDTLRYFLYGGSKSTIQIQQRMKEYLRNARMCFAYGFTEFGRVATNNFNLGLKPNSVGRVLPGYKFKITNTAGDSLEPGETGEIWCSHAEPWLGYYDNIEATAAMRDADGWFHTGDLGYFDVDGYLYVVDRIKDLLKYCNMQYCPHEIEEVITEMPDVLDVCVFGVWNVLEGDAAAATIVKTAESTLTATDVVNYVKEHTETKYKYLNAGALIVKELPKLANGKIDRAAAKGIFMRSLDGIKDDRKEKMVQTA